MTNFFQNFSKCDAIQQNVHKVRKGLFPNVVKIGTGDYKKH